MATVHEIQQMALEDLRPLVQQALGLDAWPESDWMVVGMIFDQVGIQLNRAAAPPHVFAVVVMGKELGGGIGSGVDRDPVTAIFRGYLAWWDYHSKWGKGS